MLTILFLSCRRLHFLERTVDAIRQHFSDLEAQIHPTYICFDNGSSDADRARLLRMPFDEVILSRENLGIGPAMNHLVSTVRTPYILNLQDDWVIENPGKISFVDECHRIFDHDAKIAHIKLDACHFLDFADRRVYDGPFCAPNGHVSYHVQNPQMMWGGFSFPPALTRTNALLEIGPFQEEQPYRRGWAESEFSARFTQRFVAAKSPNMVLFQHIGIEASPGWDHATQSHASAPQLGHHISIPSTQSANSQHPHDRMHLNVSPSLLPNDNRGG
jgi:hypothetical protein